MLACTYTLLCTTPPFRRWKMPEADGISFRVNRARLYCAQFHRNEHGDYRITVSLHHVAQLNTLTIMMAHEMIHLFQHKDDRDTPGVEHNADFRKLADLVSRHHGFDPRLVGG